jgi:putative hydrolase of the HAD superfamily
VEKPDPRLFHTIIDHFAVQPSEVLHIGDNVVDDFEGARAAGMRAVLLDRTRQATEQPVLHHLDQIEEALRWS